MNDPSTAGAVLAAAAYAASVALSLGLVLAFVRVARGPLLSDRIVALDLAAHQVVALICVHAAASGRPDELTVALALALVSFLGTLAFARYMERAGQRGALARRRGELR